MMIVERLERRHKARAYLEHRRRYLPAQLEATRRKLAILEREAARLGVEL